MADKATTTPNSQSSGTPSESIKSNDVNYRFPTDLTLKHAVKLSILDDKPIMMDYWTCSLEKKAFIGVREGTNEKMLVKSQDEYTSPIAKFFKNKEEFIVVTENSIYLVSSDIPMRKIS